ncbi:MAG: hypothetical protein IPK64_17285 [bacterium]|nr:hypothetical protein [bacterium]
MAALNVVVDPFGRNGWLDLGLPREQVASVVDYQIHKILAYRRAPKPAIVLGDSRAELLRDAYFAEAGRPDVFNFACGGGTLPEAIDTFWLAAGTTRLRQVVFGLPFSMYNELNRMNRLPTARQVSRDLPSYYLSPLVTKASLLVLATAATGRTFVDQLPPMSREEFWDYQLGPGAELHWRRWARPRVLLSRLEEVAEYCRAEGIDLLFVLPPSHDDYRALLDGHGLAAESALHRRELARLGRVLDLDVPGPLTADRANFDDPRHVTPAVARELAFAVVAALANGPQ